MTEDPKISRRYRELPREEPSREIDEAILAAARRAAEMRPAPLVVPSGRRRWYFPLAAAAIIVLAVAVTIHVERGQPDLELAVPPATAPQAHPEDQRIPDPKAEAPRELRAQRDAAPPGRQAAPAPSPAPASPPVADATRDDRAAAQAPAAEPQMRAEGRARLSREAEVTSAPGVMGTFAQASPEQWLQGIADLRRQGRHEEADKALAEFRKRYPDYRIPPEMLEKVERK